MTALIDMDGLVYRAGFGAKDSDLIQTIDLLDSMIRDLEVSSGSEFKSLIISGTTNFRHSIYPEYKANRVDSPKPLYYNELRDYAINQLGAIVTDGIEADDMLGMMQTDETITCTSDKDALTVPGWHYRIKKNWTDNHKLFVTEGDAWLNFFVQTLTGDKVDNIPGVKNPKKSHHKNPPNFSEDTAKEELEGKTKAEMLTTAQYLYEQEFGDGWYPIFDRNCRLLWILREPNKTYSDYL